MMTCQFRVYRTASVSLMLMSETLAVRKSNEAAAYCGSRLRPLTSSIQIGPSSATIFSKNT